MDNVMWECDYPHSDSTWPFSPEQVAEHFDETVSAHDIDRITHLNAMKHFSFDPFTTLGGKQNCTVGALRAQAEGHDVSQRSVKPENVGKHATRALDLPVPGN
jgi:hypothetical protein